MSIEILPPQAWCRDSFGLDIQPPTIDARGQAVSPISVRRAKRRQASSPLWFHVPVVTAPISVFSDQRRTKSTTWSRTSCGTHTLVRAPQDFFFGDVLGHQFGQDLL